MVSHKRSLSSPTSPSPPRLRTFPSTLSTIRSSPLASGSLASYPLTSSSLPSSPELSFTESGSPHSPDLFPFVYTPEMEPDFERIDAETLEAVTQLSNRSSLPDPNPPPPTPRLEQKTWVVFRGKTPGIYDTLLIAITQTQGFSDAFQRTYPDYASALAAWNAFTRDGIYPDYGRGPWVVFLGRKPGLIERVSELEASVKGYTNSIFRSCSSPADGNIKFQLFTQRVVEMFAGPDPDPFSSANARIPLPAQSGSQEVPTIRSATLAPIISQYLRPAPQVAESSKSALKRADSGSTLVSPMRRLRIPPSGDGWYVASDAVLPGVYCGLKALREAKPEPGGFECVANEESANNLFHRLAMNGRITWTDREE